MSEEAEVAQIPHCDICGDGKSHAAFDGKTKGGPWAFMCKDHFKEHGIGLGTGKGQRLKKDEK